MSLRSILQSDGGVPFIDGKPVKRITPFEVGLIDPQLCRERYQGRVIEGVCHVSMVEFQNGEKEFREFKLIERMRNNNGGQRK